MKYFVIWPDGQKFGPATIDELNRWIAEKRVSPDTELESVDDGTRVRAADLSGLVFESQPTQPVQPAQDPQTPTAGQATIAHPPGSSTPIPGVPVQSAPTTTQGMEPNDQYFVIGQGGQKYGPSNAAQLSQWASGHRLTPDTDLESFTTGLRVKARSVPGIIFPSSAGQTSSSIQGSTGATGSTFGQQPYGSSVQYPRGGSSIPNAGQNEFIWSIVTSVLSLVCTCFPLAIVGVVLGKKAETVGHPNGKTATIIGWICLGISLVILLFTSLGVLIPLMAGGGP